MNPKNVSLLVLAVSLLLGAEHRQVAQDHAPQEQSTFTAENDQMDRPIKVPENVLQILGGDGHVANAMKTAGVGGSRPPADWFSASEIHLANQGELDIIVIGASRMRGANINPFWLFRKIQGGYQLVLTTAAHELAVLDTKSDGFRDVRVYTMTADTVVTTTFKFNGRNYQRSDSKADSIK
jgi:hypothetical protein